MAGGWIFCPPVFAQDNGTNTDYLLKNAHGDTVKVLCNGVVVGSEDYDAYGNDTDWDSYSAYKYANYYYDSNSEFYYLRNRFYDPSIGRFISEDPVHDGMNWYAYANNNPLKYIDPNGLRSKEEADKIIKENKTYIISAAEEFGVDPAILATIIYTEQRENVDWKDDLVDPLAAGLLDVSLGIAQVKISTAQLVEDEGYIDETIYYEWHGNNAVQTSREGIILKLQNPKENIRYAAAYLKYIQDRWESEYPRIDSNIAVLATLYNQGERKAPHSNPVSNPFGRLAKAYSYYVTVLLGIEEGD